MVLFYHQAWCWGLFNHYTQIHLYSKSSHRIAKKCYTEKEALAKASMNLGHVDRSERIIKQVYGGT